MQTHVACSFPPLVHILLSFWYFLARLKKRVVMVVRDLIARALSATLERVLRCDADFHDVHLYSAAFVFDGVQRTQFELGHEIII